MQVQIDIAFDQLVAIVKHLPPFQKEKLKKELQNPNDISVQSEEGMLDFLLRAPSFTDKQLADIEKTREFINAWRTK
jgi:hypothetical protein